jgi:hypothetical protein
VPVDRRKELAVVSRLFTDRTLAGAGSALLAHAVAQAGALDRTAVLEVDVLSPALGFYLRRGWRRPAPRCSSGGTGRSTSRHSCSRRRAPTRDGRPSPPEPAGARA